MLSIHDQGAGDNGDVLLEIADPLGGNIGANKFTLGDNTVNTVELWAPEYPESDAILMGQGHECESLLDRISRREKGNEDLLETRDK